MPLLRSPTVAKQPTIISKIKAKYDEYNSKEAMP